MESGANTDLLSRRVFNISHTFALENPYQEYARQQNAC